MTISKLTDDLKISSMKELISPSDLIKQLPMTDKAITTVVKTRSDIINILDGKDERLILVVGPCSIHDVDAASSLGANAAQSSSSSSTTSNSIQTLVSP